MPLDLNQFKIDLKAEFSTSSDPTTKALVDAYWEALADKIDAYIRSGDITVSGNAETVNMT